MEEFWDARAREDAFYFVDSRLDYRDPDTAAFWDGGEAALRNLLGAVGAPELTGEETVVDIGCGLGRLTRPLAAQAVRVVAVDVSREMLDRARELNAQLDNVEWMHGDGRTLQPIGDSSVDVCISHVVFRHLPDPALTLGYVREMGRVLRPGGWAAFEFSNDPAPHRAGRTRLAGRARGLAGRGPRGSEDSAWLGSAVRLEDLRAAAASARLEVERVAGEGSEFCAVLLRRSDDPAEADTSAGGGVRPYYDRYWSAARIPRYEPEPELRKLLLDNARGSLLDVGCGAANGYAPELARHVGSYTGVDVSQHAVELAQAAGFDARVIEDAAELPFPDASFDSAVCIEVLEHLFEPHAAAREIRRVLRPGGTLVVSVPNAVYWRLRLNMLIGVWNPVGDELSAEQPWRDPHLRFFTPTTLERMLRLAGFTSVEVDTMGGCFLDHLTTRPTAFGQGRVYRAVARRMPALLGMTIGAVATA